MNFEALLAEYAPVIRDAFLRAIAEVSDDAILRQVEAAIRAGDIEGAWRALGYSQPVFNPVVVAMTNAFEAGGLAMTATMPRYVPDGSGVKAVLRFDVRDTRAEQWLRERSSSLVTNIEEDMRAAVRNTVSAGMAEGRNPRNVALDIVGRVNRQTGKREGGVLGLGEREEYWSRNLRTKLLVLDAGYFTNELRDKRFDRTVQAAIDGGKPLAPNVVDKLVDRYRVNALRHRGETIGRTEALQALNRSEYESVRQAIERSNLPAEATKKVWKTARDNRVRHSHRELHNVEVGFDQPFVSPVTGAQMMHPGDGSMGAGGAEIISCRCRVFYKTDFFYGVT